jgi:glutamine synthetase
VGHRLLGADLQELGLAEPHDDGARRLRRPLRVPRRRKIDPGEPQQGNTYDLLQQGVEIEKVPDSLGAALEALDADDIVKSAMPGRLYKVFEHYKRDEWERYLAAVTDWERDEYLEVLP